MKNIFGTDGIRARVSTYPLDSQGLLQLGKALATWAQEKYGNNVSFVVGHDPRVSSGFVKTTLCAGILSVGLAIRDAGMLATPMLVGALYCSKVLQLGIMISASHNPYYDNGIKVIDKTGTKLSLEDEEKISLLLYDNIVENYSALGSIATAPPVDTIYKNYLSSFFEQNFLAGISVVLDCAHGAFSSLAPALFTEFGAHVITVGNQPNGYNINQACGAVHPELLQKKVKEHKATIGFAFDGDGDRVLVVTAQGIIKDGDDILAALLTHPAYSATCHVIGTLMSNKGFEQYVQAKNIEFIRTNVGDKHVLQAMHSHQAALGGETSGHIILHDYLPSGDGLFVALRLCQALKLLGDWTMNMFTKYPQMSTKVAVQHKKDLQSSAIQHTIRHSESLLTAGRILVRYSGTENFLRITVEDITSDTTQEISRLLTTSLDKLINIPL